ncbi:DUF4097 family beta strand repeat-containing protein [Clostridium cibarium]|uniref:DUF4097 family beta strand repeat protein n=1 Tax=Clostridium cibarium TaxID=2762247 RepID=A0ABR8PU53_9CLOT|nr:DUF4097 family beta strand repeat protein [Clostridium cibarium]
MNKKLIKTLIAIWAIVAISLTGFLVYGIVSGKGMKNMIKPFVFSFNSETTIQKEESIDLTNLNKVNINFSSSDVVLKTTDEPKMKVVQRAKSKLDDNEKFIVDKTGDEVIIRKKSLNASSIFHFGIYSEEIEIYIPKSYNKDLNVESSSGDVKSSLETSLNKVSFSAHSGDIGMETGINANDVKIKVSSGNVDVESITSKTYDISSSSGDININSVSGSGEIESRSGDIKIQYKDISEYSNVSAHSGDINIFIPSELSFKFSGKCISGDITSDFDLNYKNKKENEATGQIGNGPYKNLDVNTSSGDIDIKK